MATRLSPDVFLVRHLLETPQGKKLFELMPTEFSRYKLNVDLGEIDLNAVQRKKIKQTFAWEVLRLGLKAERYKLPDDLFSDAIYECLITANSEGDYKLYRGLQDVVLQLPISQMNQKLFNFMYKPNAFSEAINNKFLTDEAVTILFARNPGYVAALAPEKITPHMAMVSCKASGRYFENLPDHLRTYENCMLSIKSSGYGYESLDPSLLDDELVALAISSGGSVIESLPDYPFKEAHYLAAVRRNVKAWREIPDAIKTEDFVIKACRINPEVVSEALDEQPSEALIDEIIRVSNGKAIVHMRGSLTTEERINQALTLNPLLIREIRTHLISDAVADHVIGVRGEMILYIPVSLRTVERVVAAFKDFPFALSLIPREKWTPELISRAIKQDFKVFTIIPHDLMNDQHIIEVINQNPEMFRMLVGERKTLSVCIAAVKADEQNEAFVPESILYSKDFKRQVDNRHSMSPGL